MFSVLRLPPKIFLHMSLRLFDIAPDFTAQTQLGSIQFHQWIADSWCILFSHPADFTPVCTTELGMVASMKREFERRNVKVLALSVDSIESHRLWIQDINSSQNVSVEFPIIADSDFVVSTLYDFVHPLASNRFTVRSVVVIDPEKKIRLIITYPASTGRNFSELLRVVDSLQLTSEYEVATPANWTPGEDVIIPPSFSEDEIRMRFKGPVKRVLPYLRYTRINE